MAVVTIARFIGSGGDEIASKLAERLGYDFIDSALIAQIAEHAGVSASEVRGLDEQSESKAMEWFMDVITPRIGKILLNGDSHLKPAGYIEYLKTVIQKLAEKGNIVIVGRGGQFILAEEETAFHIRVIADLPTRVSRLRQYYSISDDEALDRIKRSDSMKRNFIQRYFRGDWDDCLRYHLVINTSHLTIDEAGDIVYRAVQKFSDTRDYIPGVRDRRKRERRASDRRRGDRRGQDGLWTHRDLESALLKTGRPVRGFARPERRLVERRKGGRRSSDPMP
jgi:cytidylate kinase